LPRVSRPSTAPPAVAARAAQRSGSTSTSATPEDPLDGDAQEGGRRQEPRLVRGQQRPEDQQEREDVEASGPGASHADRPGRGPQEHRVKPSLGSGGRGAEPSRWTGTAAAGRRLVTPRYTASRRGSFNPTMAAWSDSVHDRARPVGDPDSRSPPARSRRPGGPTALIDEPHQQNAVTDDDGDFGAVALSTRRVASHRDNARAYSGKSTRRSDYSSRSNVRGVKSE
jgi:hypothetical protein